MMKRVFENLWTTIGVLMILSGIIFGGYGLMREAYLEFNDIDDYRRVIVDKRAGVVEWTTSTGGKNSQTIRHQDGAIWIKARSDVDGSECTFSERNPFHADAYVIGQYYDFERFYQNTECSKDTTPHNHFAFALLFALSLFLGLITWMYYENT